MGNIPGGGCSCTDYPVHPHACGEHEYRCRGPRTFIGSSPRLWGTSGPIPPGGSPVRFIPTPVGNITLARCRQGIWPVHPHACGEHLLSHAECLGVCGSSPRLWGTCRRFYLARVVRRFIPTPVGNIPGPPRSPLRSPVHPHACGEHLPLDFGRPTRPGSSPRLWGTLRHQGLFDPDRRFIPTPVGNISSAPSTSPMTAVHPHACGEHVIPMDRHNYRIGSSPRLWGTFPTPTPAGYTARFIPTPVGNIGKGRGANRNQSVHPHACGEHAVQNNAKANRNGSSPRLWGTCSGACPFQPQTRFIPTPVGNMVAGPVHQGSAAVHPHACGEHEYRCRGPRTFIGSSPRLWGTSGPIPPGGSPVRFIPTPVGNIISPRTKPRSWPVHPHACGEHVLDHTLLGTAYGSSPRLWGT